MRREPIPASGPQILASLLRHYRRAAGMTQEQLAERSRISVRAIRDLERGVRRAPQQQTIRLIAAALHLSQDEQCALEAAIIRIRPSPSSDAHASIWRPAQLLSPLTPLVGREAETAAIMQLLEQDEVRILTLVGPSGVGKTRLALHVASISAKQSTRDIHVVPLADVVEPSLVLSAIAKVLQVQETGGRALTELVSKTVQNNPTLIIIDGFEHLLAAASQILELLMACPTLKVMITSQAVLRVRGEHYYGVPPLATPYPSELATDERVEQYPAVALFLQRAYEANPAFTVSGSNVRIIAEICRRLEGMPLAIELAAARVRVLSLFDLRLRLDDQLSLLTGGARDLPKRQQTLRAAIEWSYQLLSTREQQIFRRLALFSGGWTIEAAETICATPECSNSAVIEDLESLVEKSLVQVVEGQRGVRFRWLEALQQFARERVEASGELPHLQTIHAHYYLSLAEAADPQLIGAEQNDWLMRLEDDHGNVRAALRWFSEGERDLTLALRLAGALWRFWQVRGHLREGREWLDRLLALARAPQHEMIPAAVKAKALNGAGNLAYKLGDYEAAEVNLTEALDLFRQTGKSRGIAAALNTLGLLVLDQGDYPRAERILEEALECNRRIEHHRGIAAVLNNLGNIAIYRDDIERAQSLYEETIEQLRLVEEPWALAVALDNLAATLIRQGDYERSEALVKQSLLIAQQLGDKSVTAIALKNLGDILREQGDFARAESHYATSIALYRQVNEIRGIAECLEGWAEGAFQWDHPEQAASMLGSAAALRRSIASPLPPGESQRFDRLIADLRAILGETTYAAASAAGGAMTLDRVIERWKQD